MKYTKEQLMPVRASKFGQVKYTCTEYMTKFVFVDGNLGGMIGKAEIPNCLNPNAWVIPIANPDDSVMILAYPENRPGETGWYIVHDKYRDIWSVAIWIDDEDFACVWDVNVDYFISILFDETAEQLESDNNRTAKIEKAKHNYHADKIEFFVFKDAVRQHNHETNEVWTEDKIAFISAVKRMLIDEGYDVTRKEPEIKPCPFCGHDDLTAYDFVYVDDEPSEMVIECGGCGLRGTPRQSLPNAIEAWNALPRRSK